MGSTTTAGALTAGTHEIDIDGVRQVYHVAGTGPVCIVHSGGPGIEWAYLRMPTLEEHLTMVYLEPVGTGASGQLADPRDYRLDTYSRFLHGVVEHLDQERVLLLGHSHGGFVIQRYALDHPDRVAGLILYDTSPVTGAGFWAEAMAGVQRYVERHPDRPEAADVAVAFQETPAEPDDNWVSTKLQRILPVYFADYWGRESEYAPMRAAVRGWLGPQLGEEPTPFDVRDQLGSITAPSLVIVGEHDFICGTRWATMLHDGIPGSRHVLLTDSGHFGHLEQPEEFTRAIVEFVG
ncbi:alpha/beta fold hydrolase [Micromonospora sp. NBC_01796]|uniref:alpha/beta fold hydrolase n=1 Tax=Micromonospora sp. NBC_01796 TaxID=2975987 RepID=UPI002DD9F398|nr:alpha/beta hydrolase [Micromonospora sp. NBC_01796]WSA82939.1 alpha/beta hydrolase [Micromonospora sp. NBC_01796]